MGVSYLSCRDIAERTGKPVRTVWNWCNSGKLKASRPGGRDYVIKESDFLAFMETDARKENRTEGE